MPVGESVGVDRAGVTGVRLWLSRWLFGVVAVEGVEGVVGAGVTCAGCVFGARV